MNTTSLNDLPEETATEILLRLSVKDLIRSSSVNKTWYSLINNPSFISEQIRKAAISCCNDNAVLIVPSSVSHQNHCSLICVDAETGTSRVIEKFDIPFDTKARRLKLLSSIHGMLLLTGYDCLLMNGLYLWNPFVKRYKVLVSKTRSACVAGMGFDKVSDDYKVIRIVYVGSQVPEAEIYSFRMNTWRKMENPGVQTIVDEDGIYVDGCYYWLAGFQHATDQRRLISFDFCNEVFREFRGPDYVPIPINSEIICIYKLMHFENSLVLCVLDGMHIDEAETGFNYCIWLMRQENGVVTWTLRFRGLLKQFGFPLAITNSGIVLIESYCSDHEERSVVSCNLKSMIHGGHGFPIARIPKTQPIYAATVTVGTSLAESLIMYEGGGKLNKSSTLSLLLKKLLKLLKCAKQAL